MRDIPIIFSAPMVRALLDGRKTQTRRLASSPLAKAQPSDRLWVREAARVSYTGWHHVEGDSYSIDYAARLDCGRFGGSGIMKGKVPKHFPATTFNADGSMRWCPSIHMPRWASRLTLVVEEVRFQRLQDISETDAIAEGADCYTSQTRIHRAFNPDWKGLFRPGFMELWDSLHGAKPGESWDDNPDIVALTFSVHRKNIDQLDLEAVHV